MSDVLVFTLGVIAIVGSMVWIVCALAYFLD